MAFRYLSFFQEKNCRKKIETGFFSDAENRKQEVFEGKFNSNHPAVISTFLALGKYLHDRQS
jgi:hypothetical protein